MDVSSAGAANAQKVQANVQLQTQVHLVNSAKDQNEVVMDTLLSSINTVQPAASVEPHLGNNIDVSA